MDSFERFWAAYPRREAKKDAKKAWGQVNAGAHLEEILNALSWQTQTDGWRRGFIPYAATYLRGERWEDENPAVTAATKAATEDEARKAWAKRRQEIADQQEAAYQASLRR